ncbi:T9SS type A sorting domain-containing protein [Acidiluteibacter ferrifornacis]|uniref:T9SS type A sorting domain-containing protein n=1 Tax=Acidiluteibacter ferrifornacis TaxID=2692424 RepID=A0A6N9NG15_9FLAO|nr:T9SS type A sorting domain-containing protein [Acidiluteibacter ferrifornacis]NBG64769.1 T9SS type A sorting domain-containing protein [Acidiluteibacter ferrifornacis]
MALKLNSFFLFLLFLTTSFAQTLNLKSGYYPIESNIETISYEDLEDSKYNNHYYVYVHFERLPDEQAKLDLRLMGFFIDSYINNKVYYCKIKSGLKLNTLKDYSVNSIFTVKPIYKLNNLPIDLVNGTYDGEDSVEVVIQSHSDFNEQDLEMLIQKVNGQINDQYAYLNLTTLTVKEKDILGLISHPLIKIIEPKILQEREKLNFSKSSPPSSIGTQINKLNKLNWLYKSNLVGNNYNGNGITIAIGEDGYPWPHIDLKNRVGTNQGNSQMSLRSLLVAGLSGGSGNFFPLLQTGAWGADLRFSLGNNAVYDLPNTILNSGVSVVSTTKYDFCNLGYNLNSQLVDRQSNDFGFVNYSFFAGHQLAFACFARVASIAGGFTSSKNGIASTNGHDAVVKGLNAYGPTLDGRIKPDISVDVSSSFYLDTNNSYMSSISGGGYDGIESTSIVNGTIAILSEMYMDHNNGQMPPSGLMKSILLNSADDDKLYVGPDFRHGWGYLNAKRASDILLKNQYFADSINNGFNKTHYLNIPSGVKQVKVMLYWNDKEAAVNSGKALVNDLDLTVYKSGVTYLPLVIDLSSPTTQSLYFTPAVPGLDTLNNAEQVVINNPNSGLYELRVEGGSIPVGSQDYFVTYVFEYKDIVITHPLPGDVIKPNNLESYCWESYDTTGFFKIELSIDNGLTWLKLADSIPDNSRVKTLNTPDVHSPNGIIRVSRNNQSTTISNFAIMDYPRNVNITSICPSNFVLEWNKVVGATSYEISLLGNKYMDSIITVTDTFVKLPYPSSMKGWFAVQPIINGFKGIRSYAIEKGTTVFNCTFPDNLELTRSDPGGIAIFDCKDYNNHNIGVTIKNNGLVTKHNPRVSYSLNNGPFVSQVFPGTILSGDSAIFYFSNIETIPSGLNTLKIYIDSTSFYVPDDTLDFKFNLYSNSQIITSPHVQNFDSFVFCTGNLCEQISCNLSQGWINPTNLTWDDIDYRIINFTTPSSGTGPSSNHTLNNSAGKYLYTEATQCFNSEAILLSPCIDIAPTETVEASFWYHMWGSDMGALHIDVIANGVLFKDYIPPIIGNQGRSWFQSKINLSPFNGQIVNLQFRAITGKGFYSDIAIDDFELSNTITTDLHERPQDSYVIFPNPSDGKFTIKSQFLQSPKQIKVYDLNGRLILTDKIQSNIHQIDLVRFGRGIYFLEIEGDVNSEFHKLIHQF